MNDINLELESFEFKNYVFKNSFEPKTEFYKIIKSDIELSNITLDNFQFKNQEIVKLIIEKKIKLLPFLFIIYIINKENLPYIQWMYINFLEKSYGKLEEIIDLKLKIKLKMENTFPFLKNKNELPEYLKEKYCKDKKNFQLINLRFVEIEIKKNLIQNKIKALNIALQYYNKFKNPEILTHIVRILYEEKKTNDALKALILLSFELPLNKDAILLWGSISIHMISSKNYWVARLGYFLYDKDNGIVLNLAGTIASESFVESKYLLENAINRNSNDSALLINYANIVSSEGRPDLALNILEKAEKLEKKFNDKLASNLLFISQYDSNVDYSKLKNKHIEISKNFKRLKNKKEEKIKNINNKIYIGFVSCDLINHPVANYFYPLVKNLSTDEFEIFIFHTKKRKDFVTKIFMDMLGNNFIDISDQTLNEQYSSIISLKIDLLVDMGGHTAGNSLELFAMKPAKFQATYVGYPFTVGLDEIQYRFSDACFPDDRAFYTEKRIDVVGSACCYQPMINKLHLIDSELYAVKEPPVLSNKYITYGISTNPSKLNNKVVETFCAILTKNCNSKLLIEANGFADNEYSEIYRKRFTNHGIFEDRIILKSRDTTKQYLIYNEIDIALDPFPYNGGTSTLDLLWMGLPMVTLEGKVGMSAVGAAYLSHLKKPHYIATTIDEYIDIAVNLSKDIEFLINERRNQRTLMEKSDLMDQRKFGINFGNAIKSIFENDKIN